MSVLDGPFVRSIAVDQWCLIADVLQEPEFDPQIQFQKKMFDIDTYKILKSFFTRPWQLKVPYN